MTKQHWGAVHRFLTRWIVTAGAAAGLAVVLFASIQYIIKSEMSEMRGDITTLKDSDGHLSTDLGKTGERIDGVAHYHSLEAALPALRRRGTGHLSSSRPDVQCADSCSARPYPVRHAQKAQRRVDARELPQTGLHAGRQQRRRASRLARSRPETVPFLPA